MCRWRHTVNKTEHKRGRGVSGTHGQNKLPRKGSDRRGGGVGRGKVMTHLSASSSMTTLCRPAGNVTLLFANSLIFVRTVSIPLFGGTWCVRACALCQPPAPRQTKSYFLLVCQADRLSQLTTSLSSDDHGTIQVHEA